MYQRYMTISIKKKSDIRHEDNNLKMQIRFSKTDVEVLTKEKGAGEPFKVVPLKEIMGKDFHPSFDHNIKWSCRTDKPPRRRLSETKRLEGLPSLRCQMAGSTVRTHNNSDSLHSL